MNTQLTVYLAIPMPDAFHGETFRQSLYDMLDELCSLSQKIDFELRDGIVYCPCIELVDDRHADFTRLGKWFSSKEIEGCEVLRFAVDVPLLLEEKNLHFYQDPPPRLTEADVEVMEKIELTHVFQVMIADLVIAANLSRVGSLEVINHVILVDGMLQTPREFSNIQNYIIREAVRYAEMIHWPRFTNLSFLQVWTWICKHKDFLEGFSASSTGRALNAFSRLFEVEIEGTPMQLMWGMIGIEALYGKGSEGLLQQIREKAQTLLGEQDVYKKTIGNMYGFRSRFVHGDLDFEGSFLLNENTGGLPKFYEGLSDSSNMATAILTATLQEMIKRGWVGLDFSYIVRDNSELPK